MPEWITCKHSALHDGPIWYSTALSLHLWVIKSDKEKALVDPGFSPA